MLIKLKNISKKFDNHIALDDINLSINKNETVVVIGNSGSGKSTLLRCINNLEEDYDGDVLINNRKLSRHNRRKLCSKIGMVFQQFHLFPHMNVMENATYGPINILKQSRQKSFDKAIKLFKDFGLETKIHSNVNNLSGGQKQRVAIVRALMMDPSIMLFDEPTSALDPEVIKDIIEIIIKLKSNMAMMIVTHHIKFAKLVADRILFMDGGKILADQPASEFFTDPSSHRARIFLENVEKLI